MSPSTIHTDPKIQAPPPSNDWYWIGFLVLFVMAFSLVGLGMVYDARLDQPLLSMQDLSPKISPPRSKAGDAQSLVAKAQETETDPLLEEVPKAAPKKKPSRLGAAFFLNAAFERSPQEIRFWLDNPKNADEAEGVHALFRCYLAWRLGDEADVVVWRERYSRHRARLEPAWQDRGDVMMGAMFSRSEMVLARIGEVATQALSEDPWLQWGQFQVLIGQNQTNVRALELAVAKFRNFYPLRELLATVLIDKGSYRDAVNHHRALLSSNPRDPKVIRQLLNLHHAREAFGPYVALYEKVRKDVQLKWIEQFQYGIGLKRLGRWKNAIEEMRALSAEPSVQSSVQNHAKVLLEKGKLELDHERTKDALESLNAAAKLLPESEDVQWHRFQALLRNGENDSAMKAIESLVRLAPRRETYLLARGDLRLEGKDLKGAQSDYVRVLRQGNDSPDMYHRLGTVKWAMGDAEAAKVNLKRALERNPNHAPSLRLLNIIEGASSNSITP